MVQLTSKFRSFAAAGSLALLAGGCASGPQTTPLDVAKKREPEQCMGVKVTEDSYSETFDPQCANAMEMVRLFDMAARTKDATLTATLIRYMDHVNAKFKQAHEAVIVSELKAKGYELNGEGLDAFRHAIVSKHHCESGDSAAGQAMLKCYKTWEWKGMSGTPEESGQATSRSKPDNKHSGSAKRTLVPTS